MGKRTRYIIRCFVHTHGTRMEMYFEFLGSGSRYPGLDPGLPGMTMHFLLHIFVLVQYFPIEMRNRKIGNCRI